MDSHHSDSSLVYTPQEYQAEQVYFDEYDTAMQEAINEADRYIEELQQQQHIEQLEEDDEAIDSEMSEEHEPSAEEDYIIDEGLLRLIVDVQSYLSEAPTDSPLLKLQYKMYTYFKHRVSEMDINQSDLTTSN